MPPRWPAQDLRASDADRDAACERLRVAAVEGRLDPLELDERLSAAYASRWCSELADLTADITPSQPPAAPPAPPVFVRSTTTNGLAVASLICGLLWMGWIGSALAIAFGHIALGQIRNAGGRQGGRALAIGGLALGYFGALTFILTMLVAVAG
jgi:hypothetical protein